MHYVKVILIIFGVLFFFFIQISFVVWIFIEFALKVPLRPDVIPIYQNLKINSEFPADLCDILVLSRCKWILLDSFVMSICVVNLVYINIWKMDMGKLLVLLIIISCQSSQWEVFRSLSE